MNVPLVPLGMDELSVLVDQWHVDGTLRVNPNAKEPTEEEKCDPRFCQAHHYVNHFMNCQLLRKIVHRRIANDTLEVLVRLQAVNKDFEPRYNKNPSTNKIDVAIAALKGDKMESNARKLATKMPISAVDQTKIMHLFMECVDREKRGCRLPQPLLIQPFLSVSPPIFVDNECQEWYGARYHNSFIIEKVLPTNIDQELGVGPLFVNRGWESLLQVDGYYYPNLVKQFYANMDKEREGYSYTINTMVKETSQADSGLKTAELGFGLQRKVVDLGVSFPTSTHGLKTDI
ncbi:hypothetical protein CCACVL1_24340 [Corchorus capsularis]|uniref:Uncharacterized protein n=1 Tax=Corchorus capsularis TaxID=210143 RepID=A0A1R3GQ38_COCAP|nr:hypothetical protein CCACVL1_24340 [Corchorus capsularis]